MQRRYQFLVAAEYQGYTTYQYLLKHLPYFSAKTIRKMLHDQMVQHNRTIASSRSRLSPGDKLQIVIPPEKIYHSEPLPLDILFENEDFLVINKPPGIAVIPERWEHRPTLKKALLFYFEQTRQQGQPKIVHRIDKEASGAVVVAKNSNTFGYLSKLFRERLIYKEYIALVAGIPPQKGRIDLKIAQASKRSSRMAISEFGKSAVTNYELLEAFRDFSLLKVVIESGRSHQIRVHLASQGYPLAIDPLYGHRNLLNLSEIKDDYQRKRNRLEKPIISRLPLHALRIAFTIREKAFTVEAPIPKDLQVTIKMLRKYRPQGQLAPW